MKCAKVSIMFFVAALLLQSSCFAQLQAVNIEGAVENLAARFEAIKNEGLGVNTLEERYSNAEYTFSNLDFSTIDSMLSDSSTATSINSVLELFDSISSDSSGSSPVSPVDCCDQQSSTDVCCFFCEDADTSLTNRISGAYSQSNLQDGTLQFLTSNGTLISHPHTPPFNASTCDEQDARLQPSYQGAVRDRPLEVVMMLDLATNPAQVSGFTVPILKDAVRLVLRSLGTDDRVAVLGVDSAASIPPIVSRLAPTSTRLQTVPVCDETITELEAYVTSYTLRSSVNYTDGFANAFGLLSNSTITDKLILLFSYGDVVGNDHLVTFRDNTFPLIQQLNSATGNSTVISVFRIVPATIDSDYNNLLEDVVSLSTAPGSITTFGVKPSQISIQIDIINPLPQSVADYSPFSISQSRAIKLGHEAGNLAISQLYFDGNSDLVGVFHASLPWRQLLGHLAPSLANRRSSYLFVIGPDRSVLYHPLLPDSRLVRLMVTDVESEGVIGGVLDMVDSQSSTTQQAPVLKRMFVPSGSSDPNGFLLRDMPSEYYCRNSDVNGHTVYLCLLLADEDVSIGSLQEIDDVRSVYNGNNEPPIYHNVVAATELSDSTDELCNYFCKPSLNSAISFQLTGPDVPADTEELVSALTSYIEGRSNPPNWVQTGVSTEVGVASVVSSHWLNTTGRTSDHITRRHLVTSSGAYLTFPPVHLNREFNPMVTEWFLSTLPRPGIITLTPPRVDVLREGGNLIVSAGYPIKAPTSQDDVSVRDSGHVLSVLAADLTFNSLRAFIREALPECGTDSRISCIIVDDLGNFIYGEEVANEPSYRGGAHFMGQPLGSNDLFEYRAIVRDVLRIRPDLFTKQRCVDHFNTSVKTRRFFQFNTNSNEISRSISSRSCIDYKLSHIPGTNAFLIVRERGNCRGSLICICNSDSRCSNCELFRTDSCECPCTCTEDCERTSDILACPQLTIEDPRFEVLTEARDSSEQDNLCFNQGCNCRTDFESCYGVRECSWCSAERKCIHYTECCEGDNGCCVEKLDTYGSCVSLANTCFNGNNGQFNQTCPIPDRSTNTAVIVAVVIGCVFGALLIALFVVFIVWYQCFRLADPKDETSRESAFDFSNKRTESTNPTAVAGGSELNEKSPVTSPTNGGSEEGQTETKMDIGDSNAYDEIKS